MTLAEIQNRFQNALLYLSCGGNMNRAVPEEVLELAQRFSGPRMSPILQIRPEELVTSFLSLLVVASDAGINLEEKADQIISQLEQPSFFSA